LIGALVFDFDGVILETEEPDYQSWQEAYQREGTNLPLDLWVQCIGRAADYFDPLQYLEDRLGREVDRPSIAARRRRRYLELVRAQSLRPGVIQYIHDGQNLGLKLAIASSSSKDWVLDHLRRFGLDSFWDSIRCREDVTHVKPAPDLYLSVLESLGIASRETVAIEDSPNGIAAAKAAGMLCLAVPNVLTAGLDLRQADFRLDSLDELRLPELIRHLVKRQTVEG
jgi:HAD superfamily hydrolase (TIGR01509 family)